jgi:hypothetical protein
MMNQNRNSHYTGLMVFGYKFQTDPLPIPAMQAGLADHVWEIEELVGLID